MFFPLRSWVIKDQSHSFSPHSINMETQHHTRNHHLPIRDVDNSQLLQKLSASRSSLDSSQVQRVPCHAQQLPASPAPSRRTHGRQFAFTLSSLPRDRDYHLILHAQPPTNKALVHSSSSSVDRSLAKPTNEGHSPARWQFVR